MSTPETNVDQPLLRADQLSFSYGAVCALREVSIVVDTGEAVCVIGPNGAGKSTLARIVGGLARPASGTVRLAGAPLPSRSWKAVTAGVASVLEGRRLFPDLSVRVNLEMGAYSLRLDAAELDRRIERVLALFPALRERIGYRASLLSGGEQQMVAIGRALISEPKLLVLDEPTMGLSPKNSVIVFEALSRLRDEGLALLLIEQNASLALRLSDRGYALRQGQVAHHGTAAQLAEDGLVREIYLGA
ncbi:ABC transporter ATP-binding protein [Micromonospora sonneratiae]|uniref:ABC transporter ATP-binding protein n=1 Tax=Micromonospora sonneratiae TaxID=1184706 RepID=A0ABW3Y8K1_9ACTN